MAKTIKKQFTAKNKVPFFSSPGFLYFAGTIFVVFFIYSFSLFRPWLPFDERLFYNEEFLPIPTSFNEIFEIIKSFVLGSHIVSTNNFFSKHLTLRSDPFAWSILIFILFFFKKNAVLYHLLQLFIHLANSIIVFLIFKKSREIFKKSLNNFDYLTISIFTVIWALHSANTEAILLVTNWNALLTYTFCLCFIFYETSKFEKNLFFITKSQAILTSILFFILMFITEYGYTFPVIIFFIVFAYNRIKSSNSIKEVSINAIKISMPYFIGLFLFFLFSVFKPDSAINNIINSHSPIYAFIERNLWLVPQLFIHFLKLLFFPKALSLYQSNLVHLSNKLISPYSIFCSLSYLLFLLLPLILFFLYRKKAHGFIYPLIYAFYFSIFPFLHIITPTYCLSADRYCYFPSFVLLLVLIQPIYLLLNGQSQKFVKPLFISLSLLVLLLGIRTLFRIQEWNDPYKLYNSAAKIEKNLLYKGQRLNILADYVGEHLKDQDQMESLLEKSLSCLNKALQDFKTKSQAISQPITLKIYGLDYKTLTQKAAYSIAVIKNDNYREPPQNTLAIFEPYIENDLNSAGISQISFYADLLLKNNEIDKAKYVYKYAYKKYPFVLEISLPLSDLYLNNDNNPDKALKILQESYKYYPNKGMPMYKLLKFYETSNDPLNQAKYAYLLGLREHSVESYQHAAQIYLDINKLQDAKKTLDKLIQLNPNNPFTLLQLSKYLDLSGNGKDILEILNKAYLLNKASNTNEQYVTKAIVESLINVNFKLGNVEAARKYFSELEDLQDLTKQDIEQIKSVKRLLYKTN